MRHYYICGYHLCTCVVLTVKYKCSVRELYFIVETVVYNESNYVFLSQRSRLKWKIGCSGVR